MGPGLDALVVPWVKLAGAALSPLSAGAVNQDQALEWAEEFLFVLV